MLAACELASCRPVALPVRQRRPAARRAVAPRAMLPMEIIQIAEEAVKPGTVDAPVWAIAVGAIVVTAASLLLSLGLKPGTDAAIEMQKRDAKKFNKRD